MAVKLNQFQTTVLKPNVEENLEITQSMNVMVSFFTIPSKFIRLLKVFVAAQQKAYFSLIS